MSHIHHCDDERPCPAPPHPDLLARIRAARLAELPGTTIPDLLPDPLIPGLNDGMIYSDDQVASGIAQSGMRRADAPVARGPLRVAIVLVDFSDQRMSEGANDRIKELFFSTGKLSTGSVSEYFANVSGGKISLAGDVVGPFLMPLKMTEYAHGASGSKNYVSEPNTRTLGRDALAAATGKLDFSTYDNDGDKQVDAFIVVHAGGGAEEDGDLNKIWSVQWTLPKATVVNGVTVNAFLTVPEDAYIGVCAHELGHLLFSWPDLYDSSHESAGVGYWCLMGSGCWGGSPGGTKPVHPSAWCKQHQGWATVVNETENRRIRMEDVKSLTGAVVHRLWTNGNAKSKEYFLLENRQKTGYDEYLPGDGLLIWHIDDNVPSNNNRTHYKVALMQADGKNQLGLEDGGRGDAGDSFPGSSNNVSFTSTSNPNSRSYYGNADTLVSVTRISPSYENMYMDVEVVLPDTPTPFSPVYRQGEPGNGIGGYDLSSTSDLIFEYDYDGTGKLDHLVLYRPGKGICWILENDSGAFKPKYPPTGSSNLGIGGFDLQSPTDRGFAFDYESSGKLNYLVFYRPGEGACFILARNGTGFRSVYAEGQGGWGIGGYDLSSTDDRMFAIDFKSNGKRDHICAYRPGKGIIWILERRGLGFGVVLKRVGDGLGGYDLSSKDDRAFAFDMNGLGKMDSIVFYRPGTGTIWIVRAVDGVWKGVWTEGQDHADGIGGYDLQSTADVCFAFDWTHSGINNHIALYRPGTGIFWVVGPALTGGFRAVLRGEAGKGLGGYDLSSAADKAFAFDYSHTGKQDHIVLYRTDGRGTIWILEHSLATPGFAT